VFKIPSKILFQKIILSRKVFFQYCSSLLPAKTENFRVWPVPLFADLGRIFQQDEVQLSSPVTASIKGRKGCDTPAKRTKALLFEMLKKLIFRG